MFLNEANRLAYRCLAAFVPGEYGNMLVEQWSGSCTECFTDRTDQNEGPRVGYMA